MVEFLNSNDKEKHLTGIRGLKTGCLPNIKIVQLAPGLLKIPNAESPQGIPTAFAREIL